MQFSIQNTTCPTNVNQKLDDFKNRFNIAFSQVFEDLTGLDSTSLSFSGLEPALLDLEESLINHFFRTKNLNSIEAICSFFEQADTAKMESISLELNPFLMRNERTFYNWVFLAVFDTTLKTSEFHKDFGIALALYQDAVHLFQTYENGKFKLTNDEKLALYDLCLTISKAFIEALNALTASKSEKETYLKNVANNPIFRDQELKKVKQTGHLYNQLNTALFSKIKKAESNACMLEKHNSGGKHTILRTAVIVTALTLTFKVLKGIK